MAGLAAGDSGAARGERAGLAGVAAGPVRLGTAGRGVRARPGPAARRGRTGATALVAAHAGSARLYRHAGSVAARLVPGRGDRLGADRDADLVRPAAQAV